MAEEGNNYIATESRCINFILNLQNKILIREDKKKFMLNNFLRTGSFIIKGLQAN